MTEKRLENHISIEHKTSKRNAKTTNVTRRNFKSSQTADKGNLSLQEESVGVELDYNIEIFKGD